MQPLKIRKNVNDIWKELDPLFQTSIRSLILSNNTSQFNKLTKELGFNTVQKKLLFEAIYISKSESEPNIDYISSHQTRATSPSNSNLNSNNKLLKKSIIGKKRCRSPHQTQSISPWNFDSNLNNLNKPLKKRRKKTRKNSKSKSKNNKETDVKEMEKNGIYEVESIVNHRNNGRNNNKDNLYPYTYKIKWLGYDSPIDLTWEPFQNLQFETVKIYWKLKGYKIDKHGNIEKIKIKKNMNKINEREECNNMFENSCGYYKCNGYEC